MTRESFDNVKYWIFDLDNTLYPKTANLFAEIEVKMTSYVMEQLQVDFEEANFLRDYYWKKYGTTLAGMMKEHEINRLLNKSKNGEQEKSVELDGRSMKK